MILDIYQHFREHPGYNKILGGNYVIAEYKCPLEKENFQVMSEWHFITYVISGKKDWITPTRTYHVKEGEAIFVKKGVYSTKQYFEDDHCVLLFLMNDEFIRNFMIENAFSFPARDLSRQEPILHLNVEETMKSIFYSVFNYLRMAPAIPQKLVEIKFKELLFNIVLDPKHENVAQYFSSIAQDGKTSIDQVMLTNFHHDISLEDFARLCNRSLSSFKRDFKNLFGQSPGKWINERRLEYAQGLLLSSDMNVTEICHESGFKNASHFNKAFKEKFHIPPMQFRLQARKPSNAIHV